MDIEITNLNKKQKCCSKSAYTYISSWPAEQATGVRFPVSPLRLSISDVNPQYNQPTIIYWNTADRTTDRNRNYLSEKIFFIKTHKVQVTVTISMRICMERQINRNSYI